jgi:hypothetical protein
MAEEQKVQQPVQKEAEKVVQPQEATSNAPKPEEKKKMGTGAKIAIGCGVLLLLGLIALGVLGFAGVSFFSKITDEFEGVQELVEDEYIDDSTETEEPDSSEEESESEDEFTLKKSTEQGVDGELESESMLSDRFPEDIPLSGGKITASSYSDLNIIAELDVNTEIEEVKEWYLDALRENGWEITSQSEDEPVENWTAIKIAFQSADGERRGDINIEQTPYTEIPHVRIRELLY